MTSIHVYMFVSLHGSFADLCPTSCNRLAVNLYS